MRYDEAVEPKSSQRKRVFINGSHWNGLYTYNDDNQMTMEAKKREGNLTKQYTFQYDANGNLTKECFRNKEQLPSV